MTNMLWVGPMLFSVWLAVLTMRARRHWVAAYLLAVFFGFGAGAVAWNLPDALRGLWWLVWAGYAFFLPVVRVFFPNLWDRDRYETW